MRTLDKICVLVFAQTAGQLALSYDQTLRKILADASHCFQPGGRERLYCFPLFAHGQLITTSVTSHSNRSKLSLAWLV